MRYESARSKAEAVARMYYLGNQPVEPLGPGSKEKKAALVALGRFVGLDLSGVSGKHECGRLVAAQVGVVWDGNCISAGDTITLTGMNRIIDGAVDRYIRSGGQPARSLLRDIDTLNPAPRWDDYAEDNDVSDDWSEIEQSIADSLVELARDTPTPVSIDISRSRGATGLQISVEEGTWRSPLAAVQGWLRLPSELDESSPEAFDQSLSSMLGVSSTDGQAGLLVQLQERLERAQALRAEFLEALDNETEGAETLETASAKWVAAWDGVEEIEEAETSGPVQADADTWPIAQFRQYAMDGELNLSPSYQRADVWPTADAQQLIESILRGIPLPSVILLKRNTETGDQYEIIDGKQRLTSVLRFTAAHPKAVGTVRERAGEWGIDPEELVHQFQSDYPAFKKMWRKYEAAPLTAKAEKELYFPFSMRPKAPALNGELASVKGRYYSEIKKLVIPVGNARRRIDSLFEAVSDYRVPVILYHEASTKQIHEVFTLYNKQGKHLNAEEIRNAAFHQLELMRALLATSGDSDGIDGVAPFLAPVWDDLRSTAEALADPFGPYALADAGYKRSKLLSWVAAALLHEDEALAARSTAAHINNLLEAVQNNPRHPLRDTERVISAMVMLDRAVDAHQTIPTDGWDPDFRNAQGRGRWQELQLVAAVTGLGAAHAVYGDDLPDIAWERTDDIRAASTRWARPRKTQSREQWEFIAGVVREFLGLLDVDHDRAHEQLLERFGSSGLRRLLALEHPEWWR